MLNNQNFKNFILIFLITLIIIESVFAVNKNEPRDKKNNILSEYEIGTVISNNEKMKWIIIDVDKNNPNKYLLINKNIIDARVFNRGLTNYKNSKIRYYLNGEFFDKNFSEEEKKHIQETEIETKIKISENNINTIKTIDKIFILSIDELKKYNILNMKLTSNSYVKKLIDKNLDMKFWTRDIENEKSYFLDDGTFKLVDFDEIIGVLPAMWYDFSNIISETITNEQRLIDRIGIKKNNIEFTLEEQQNAVDLKKIKKYYKENNIFEFGKYNKEKLAWTILDSEGNDFIAISNYIIDYIELEYDNYDNEILKNNAYRHSNIKKYLNDILYKTIFNDYEKEIISKITDYEYIKIPSIDDVYRYALSDTNGGIMETSKAVNTKLTMCQTFSKPYFIDAEYVEDDITYLMSVVFNNVFNYGYVSNNYKVNVEDDAYSKIVLSGIRPMIKVNKEKIIEWTGKKNLGSDIVELEHSIKFKDKFLFGKYEQDFNFNNGKENIVWTCIKQIDDNIILFSDKIIDVLDYSDELEVLKFSDSYLRNFANSDFLNEAFNDDEKKFLNVVKDNDYIDMTYDRVFFLSSKQNFEDNNKMYNDILETNETEFVKNKYGEINSYLKQDLYQYGDDSSIKFRHYMQISNKREIVSKFKTKGGFRPMICLKEKDVLKLKKYTN